MNKGVNIGLKGIKIIGLFLCIFSLSGCVFATNGNSINSFSQRLNNLQENNTFSAENYIIDKSASTLTKYFKFNQNEIMLQFKYDHKNRLNEMNIAFDFAPAEGSEELQFIEDLITAFCQSEEIKNDLLNSTDFENAIRVIRKETISAESGNIKMEIDVTQLGTVISFYKDI